MNLTLNPYTHGIGKQTCSIYEFLRLRADSHAQYEIRAYADVMLDTLKNGFQ